MLNISMYSEYESEYAKHKFQIQMINGANLTIHLMLHEFLCDTMFEKGKTNI